MKHALVAATTVASNDKDDDESSCCRPSPVLNVFSFPLSSSFRAKPRVPFPLDWVPFSVSNDHEGLIRVLNMHVLSLSLSLSLRGSIFGWVGFRHKRSRISIRVWRSLSLSLSLSLLWSNFLPCLPRVV